MKTTRKSEYRAYVDLFPTPFPSHLCLCCGGDPCDLWDTAGRYRIGSDPTRGLNENRHCEDCAKARLVWR